MLGIFARAIIVFLEPLTVMLLTDSFIIKVLFFSLKLYMLIYMRCLLTFWLISTELPPFWLVEPSIKFLLF
jgi:hypothetical protein